MDKTVNIKDKIFHFNLLLLDLFVNFLPENNSWRKIGLYPVIKDNTSRPLYSTPSRAYS